MPSIGQVISALEEFAPLSLQEEWDNSGLQVGDRMADCTGVLLCVDPTPAIIAEAVGRGCNLVVSHHPLIFRGIKHLTGATPVEQAVIAAVRAGVAVYSAHTSLDSTPGGVSWAMARKLGAKVVSPLSPSAAADGAGLGVVAELAEPVSAQRLVRLVKDAFGSPVCRCTVPPAEPVTRIAMCGGAGGEFIGAAVRAGACAYISSDIRYHDFVEYSQRIFLIDIAHYESEACAKEIFSEVITEKFPNFAVYFSTTEENPIKYL